MPNAGLRALPELPEVIFSSFNTLNSNHVERLRDTTSVILVVPLKMEIETPGLRRNSKNYQVAICSIFIFDFSHFCN
jgi:hypothetical protein